MTVGEVISSRAVGFAEGATVWHAFGWRDYAVVKAGAPALGGLATLARLDTTLAPANRYLGPLGGIGLTAYAGLLHAAGLRPGDVVWVSAAAGAVGSLAAQFAKLRGHRVIGSAGSDAKVVYLRDELGLDAAFNYRTGPVAELLAEAAPDGIDVYFDNVGGEHLEAALGALRRRGRVALCGAIAGYDREDAAPGSAESLSGDGQRADPARLPRQQLRPPDGRDAGNGRGVAERREASLPRVDRRRTGACARGTRAHARRRDGRQDAGQDRRPMITERAAARGRRLRFLERAGFEQPVNRLVVDPK